MYRLISSLPGMFRANVVSIILSLRGAYRRPFSFWFGVYTASCLIAHGSMMALHISRYSCIARVLCPCLSLTPCFFFWVIFGLFWVCGLCNGYRKHRVLLVPVALHMNWVALADIHFMLPGWHGHERGSTISQWDMGWEVKDSGWLLGSSGIVHEDRLGMIRFVRLKLQYIDRDIV